MKFGMESEKLLFDLKDHSIYHGVFRLVDALSDYISYHGEEIPRKITNEFVLNMVEINCIASQSQREVIEDYLLLHQIVTDVASRERVVPLPLAAVPFQFTPNMVPKWPYYVQNSILSGKRLREWTLSPRSPMADAGNCAGLHVHFEIGTAPEFLMFSSELVNKHNMGLMLTPMVAFSASPYFYGEASAASMRASRYYHGVYENYPLNGGLPPVMQTSEEVLRYTLAGIEHWVQTGVRVGFEKADIEKLTAKKGANWSMLRWNRTWNTIELRCLESDRIDYDIGKFAWAAGAMKRLDVEGENLKPEPLAARALDAGLIAEALQVSGDRVSILPTDAIRELTDRAVKLGLKDELVAQYLQRLHEFSLPGVDEECVSTHQMLKRCLDTGTTTAQVVLDLTQGAPRASYEEVIPILLQLVQQERSAMQSLRKEYPTVIAKNRRELFPAKG